MARRSGRKTKAPEYWHSVLSLHDSSTQTSHQCKRPKRNLLTLSNALQTNSPILKEDLQSLLASTVRTWSSLSEDEKRNLINNFPPAYRIYRTTGTGALECPITEDFAANDSIVKRDVARFRRDIEAGFYAKKWQGQGKRAMRERAEGQFDEYIKQQAEDSFGQIQRIGGGHYLRNGAPENRLKSDDGGASYGWI